MGFGPPLLCSDFKENLFIVEELATIFEKGNVENLKSKLEFILNNQELIRILSNQGKVIIQKIISGMMLLKNIFHYLNWISLRQ